MTLKRLTSMSPEVSAEDLQHAESIRVWVEGRQSDRAAWNKLSSLVAVFGAKRLTQDQKHRMPLRSLEPYRHVPATEKLADRGRFLFPA